MMRSRLGVYVHIPYCIRKCSYCDFNSGIDYASVDAYVDALSMEIRHKGESLGRPRIHTIYLGGGTPSSIELKFIRKILDAIKEAFLTDELEETTIECNPGTVDMDALRVYRTLGIDRISIGVQSFDDEMLVRLGRIHSGDVARETIRLAREAGFDNLSIDLMYGLPMDRLDRLESDVKESMKLGVDHLSAYGLILEEGTKLKEEHDRGNLFLPDEDALLQMRQRIGEILQVKGLRRYEIANYAKPGFESIHNLTYWHNEDYLGFGLGATGKVGDRRRVNPSGMSRYLDDPIGSGTEEAITETMSMEEGIFLGLRLVEGIGLTDFKERYGIDINERYKQVLVELKHLGAIETNDGKLRLTPLGMDISNWCMAKFLS